MAEGSFNNKIGNCLKGIKSCLKSIKNSDYEFVSYEKQINLKPTFTNASESKQVFSNNILKSNSIQDLQNYNKQIKKSTTMSSVNHQMNDNSHESFISVAYNSSKLYFQDDDSMYFSALDLVSSKQNRISSTMINDLSNKNDFNTSRISQTSEFSQAFTNPTYSSPKIDRTKSFSSFQTATDEIEHTQYQSYELKNTHMASFTSEVFLQDTQLDSKNVEEGLAKVYVCVVPYQAKMQSELTLNYAERVQLIHTSDGMSLVQNISTKQCGYVPYFCITLLAAFLNQI